MHNEIYILDAGNSRIKFGLFRFNPEILPVCVELSSYEWNSGKSQEGLRKWVINFLEKYRGNQLGGNLPQAILAGSNFEAMDQLLSAWPDKMCHLVCKKDRGDFPLVINVDFPEKVGMDRLLNSLAVSRIKPAGHLGVIVDSGTATTVDVIDQHGKFQGGAILPGLRLCALALHHYTSQLPYVDVNHLTEIPLRPIGKNTHEAILNGILWGHLGAIRELVQLYSKTSGAPVSCYITGGAAPLIIPHLNPEFIYYPTLPLQGLAVWYQLTK